MADILTDDQVWSTETPTAGATQPQNDNRPLSDEEVWTPPAQQIADKQNASKSITSAFAQGFSESTQNYEQLGISPENQEIVHKSGVYKNAGILGQAIYDQLVTPAAATLDAAMRTGVGATVSGPLYAANQALTNVGLQTQNATDNQSEAATEMVLDSPFLAEFHLPEFTIADFAKAKSAAVTMPEEIFTGVKDPTPEQAATMHNAAAEIAPEASVANPAAETPSLPDIHQAARNVDPETFQKYDKLSSTQDDLRNQLQEMRNTRAQQFAGNEKQLPQVQDEISTLQANADAIIGGKNETDLSPKNLAKVQDIRSQIDDLKGLQDHLSGVDTTEMSALRQKIQETNYAMRDLAPDVSAAYRKAQEGIGVEAEETKSQVGTQASKQYTIGQDGKGGSTVVHNDGRVLHENEETGEFTWEKNQNKGSSFLNAESAERAAQEATRNEKDASDFQKELEERRQLEKDSDNGKITIEELNKKLEELSSKYTKEKPIDDQKKSIIADQAQKLIAAGRPAEEANAAAQLVAEHYAARAERFGGKNGTAEEMYNRDMATVKAGRDAKVRQRELAQEKSSYETSAGNIPRAEENLSENDRNVESRLADKVGNHYQDAVKEYNKLPETNGGKIINTDSARELSKDYMNDRTKSAAVHEPASWFSKRLYADKLKEAPKEGESNTVAFTAGGTGAGKSTAVKMLGGDMANSQIIYDTNMNKLSSSVQKIEQALDAGKDVKIAYVYRDPVDALINGALPRAERMAKRLGSGRTVPLEEHANTHIGSLGVVKQLLEKYKEDPRVSFKLIDNSGGRDGARLMSIEKLNEITHNDLHGKLSEALEKEKAAGKVSDATYKGFKGEDGLGSGNSEQPEPERDGGSRDELNQSARGKIRLATDDAKAAITLMKSANASTFIHEAGHHWLDELMRDATDENAPDDLIQDSKTVRDWLGVKDGDEIPKKSHEKFARGFERYLMEGTAPSKQLAVVFAKFKQWLTKLYQTVDRLRSPINDDIRDVFDRLLAKNPEKTIIAPDHESGKMMADIHEADAEHTEPQHAAEVADNINDERQRLKGQNNVTDTKNSAGNAGNAEPSTTSPTATGESAPIQQPDAVGTSGVETKAEGGQLRAATEQPKLSKPNGTSASAGSAKVLPNPKSDLIDKAGNIRLENLNAPESVNEVIRQIAAENNDFNDARGVVSDDQVMRLADSLGVKASEIQLKRIASIMGPGQLASKIMAARKILIQSATNVRDLMAQAAIGSDEDVMAYAEAKQRHIMIQSQVSGVTAEAGRALRAFRGIEGSKEAQSIGDFLKQATGKDLFQLKEEAKLGSTLDTPEKVSKFIEDSKKPSFGDMILEYWVNGLISGPATHTTYAIGNTLLGLWKAIPETAMASVMGALRGENTIKLGEVGTQLKGAYENLPLAVSAAAKAAKTGLTTLLPNEEMASTTFGGKGIPAQIGNEAVTWRQAGSDAFGAIKGLRDAFIASGDLVQTGAIPDFALGGLKIPVGSIIRAPARAIAAIHSFFRTVNYSMDKSAIAYRTAVDEGLEGNNFDARVADIVQNPSAEIMAQARGTATNLTLMGEGGDFTKAISKLTNASVDLPILGQTKLLKFIDPFVHIGSNVIDQAILQRTPVGLLSSQIRADLSGANGSVARDFAASRMIVGSALAMTIGGLASEGLVSGSGPSDPKAAAAWKLAGNQPHSVKIGDMWYDAHRLGPLGMLVGIAADLHDVVDAIGKEDLTKVSAMLVHAITQNILDESFMRGPSDLIKALTDSDRYGDAYIRTFVSSFVPFSVGLSQEARAIDPYTRQTRTVMDAIKDKIPYVSESLYPRRDVWGQPIPNKDVLGIKGLSAIYESRISQDPVNQTLSALGYAPAQPERKIRGVQLTDQQYDDFSKIAGQLAKMRLDSIVNNPEFKNLPEVAQLDAIKGAVKSSRKTASSVIMMRNPDLIKKATEQKIAIMTTGKKKTDNQ